MKNELEKVNPQEFGLEQVQAETIEQAFLPKIAERDGYAVIYEQLITKELTPETCKQARELRLKLVKTRTGIAEIHKTQKAYYLAAGKFCDAWKNKETLPVEQMEEKLGSMENHFENIEKARIAALQVERLKEVSEFTEHPASDLGNMQDEVYSAYLQGLKVSYTAKKEAELKAEQERLTKEKAEKEEQEKIKLENERLKKEAEIAAQEQAKLKAELGAKLKSEQDAKEAAEKEKARQEAEAKKLAKAPIKNQLNVWVDFFEIESAPIDNETSKLIKEKFSAFKVWAKSEIEKL